MAKPNKKAEAEKLFVQNNMAISQIAEELEIAEQTVYRWKNEAAKKGEAFDWDTQRRIWNMSPRELLNIYMEMFKGELIRLKKNPKLLLDPKTADAIAKHISAMQKLDPKFMYLGIVVDLIKTIDKYLAEIDPGLRQKMAKHWEAIKERLVEYSTRKGIF